MLSNFGAPKFDSASGRPRAAQPQRRACCVAMLRARVAAGAARCAQHRSGDALLCTACARDNAARRGRVPAMRAAVTAWRSLRRVPRDSRRPMR